jgi:hypothetical protein
MKLGHLWELNRKNASPEKQGSGKGRCVDLDDHQRGYQMEAGLADYVWTLEDLLSILHN